jgi:site-specific DNA recombinase
MTRAAIYVRISSDPEGRGLGVTRQEEDCRTLAERLSWDVSAVYKDNDVSASGKRRRPAWEQLLDDIEGGRIDSLVAYSSSRLYRNLRDLGQLLDLAEVKGLSIATVASGDVDVSTADGRMLARILASVDQAEWERLSERSHRQRPQHAENGGKHASLGFGYTEDGTIVTREPMRSETQPNASSMVNRSPRANPGRGRSRCGETKATTAFRRHRLHKDGFASQCKACTKETTAQDSLRNDGPKKH